MNTSPAVFKESIIFTLSKLVAPLIMVFILSTVIKLIFKAEVSLSMYLLLFCFLETLMIIISFLIFNTVYLNEETLIIKNMLRSKTIVLKDIISVDMTSRKGGGIRYIIKTNSNNTRIPLVKSHIEFENLLIKYANLRYTGDDGLLNIFTFPRVQLKHWKK